MEPRSSRTSGKRSGEPAGYEGHFDLREPPFALTANPRYVFESRSLSSAVQEITRALERHEPVTVITGAAGTGKTLMCRTLANMRDPHTFVAVVSAAPASRDDLLRQLLDQFGLLSADSSGAAAASRFELVRTLEQFLASLAKVSARAVIVVDEAQRLSSDVLDELRWLSNFETDERKLLQIVLLGEPLLDEMIERPEFNALRQRITRRHALGALMPDEVAPYIERRVRIARGGRDAPALFTRGAAETVAEIADGIPRVVNVLCDRALSLAHQQNRSRVDRTEMIAAARDLHYDVSTPDTSRRRLSIAAAAVAAFAIGGTAVWWAVSRTPAPPQAGAATPAVAKDAQPAQPQPATAPANPQSSAAVDQRSQPDSTGSTGSTGQPFDVLASSFRSPARAEALVQQAAALGLPARVRASAEWHQVVVGPYATRDEADKAREALKQLFIPDAEIVSSVQSPSAPPQPPPASAVSQSPPPPPTQRPQPLAAATPEEILRRATAMSQAPDVKGLMNLRRQVESRPSADPAADTERAAMLQQIDTLLDEARKRQLELDSQSYQGTQPAAPR
jgi:general secretion pathway protein A